MTRDTFLYALWCLAIVVAYGASTTFGYSPYADGGRPIFVHGGSGPQHK